MYLNVLILIGEQNFKGQGHIPFGCDLEHYYHFIVKSKRRFLLISCTKCQSKVIWCLEDNEQKVVNYLKLPAHFVYNISSNSLLLRHITLIT